MPCREWPSPVSDKPKPLTLDANSSPRLAFASPRPAGSVGLAASKRKQSFWPRARELDILDP